MSRPIITLTTDFGNADTYVAQMKGVILEINPDTVLVDITHSVRPQDIVGGARQLDEAVGAFPAGSIHLAVVDPGVGTERALIGVEVGGFRFVAPNNGLLSPLLQRLAVTRVHQLVDPRFRRPTVSRTFHGRDILAPAAAHWSLGIDLAEFGPPLKLDEIVRMPMQGSRWIGDQVTGEVVSIDHFGNLITNIRETDLPTVHSGSLVIAIAGTNLSGLHPCYATVPHGALLAIVGSSGHLEIAVNGGSATAKLACAIGTNVTVTVQ